VRVVVDCRYVRVGQYDGITRYTVGLVTELAKRHPLTMLISDHRQLDMLPALPWQLVTSPTSIREPFVARQVSKLRPDIVFSPMQTMGSLGRDYKLLLTVHDLIYYENRTPPRDLSALVRLLWRLYHMAWWPQRMLLNRADGVVTVSETTAQLIHEHRLTDRPVTVVPNAADELGAPPLPRVRPARHRLVYMGSFMPYKNVDTVVRAVAALPDHELHILSRIDRDERSRLTRLAPQARLVFHDGVTDAAYAQMLANATALVTASRAEGFGIPLIEAMRFGTPVVVSDIPIFREIGGDAALFFDPDDPEALVAALWSLEREGEWEWRSAASVAVAARYDWSSSAEKLLELMRRTAGRGTRRRGPRTRLRG
jgi:glycosyltransferase involved in cell wall biosynthesis